MSLTPVLLGGLCGALLASERLCTGFAALFLALHRRWVRIVVAVGVALHVLPRSES
jgi:hypothetical protein